MSQRGTISLPLIGGVMFLVIVIAGILYLAVQPASDGTPAGTLPPPTPLFVPIGTPQAATDVITSGRDTGFKPTGPVIAGSAAPLIDFNQADYERALASDKLIVLYFYANWCPICAEETRDALYPAFNDLTTPDVVGFRVNFNDSETDAAEEALAREFGIAYQHTKVFLKNGERKLKSPESWTKDRYLSEIASHL